MKILTIMRSAALAVGWTAGSAFASVVAPQNDYLWIEKLDLYIPVSANGSVKASEIEYETIDFIECD